MPPLKNLYFFFEECGTKQGAGLVLIDDYRVRHGFSDMREEGFVCWCLDCSHYLGQ